MADMNKSINIEVTATDDASKPIEKIGKESKGSLSAVKRFGAGAASAFAKVGAAGVMINQSIELVKKFRDVGLIAIEATRAFVDANDPLIKSFDKTSTSVKKLGAGVGVILMKGLNGAAKALDPIIKKTQAWLQKNQNLIGLKLVEYIERFAKFSLVAAAKGLILISKITSGLSMTWVTLKIAVNSYYAALLSGGAKALEKMASLADAVGADGLAGKLRAGAQEVKSFGDIFQSTADESTIQLDKQVKAQEAFEGQVKKNGEAVYKAIGQVATAANKAFVGETVLANQTLEQQTAIVEKQKTAQEKLAESKRLAAEEDKKAAADAEARAAAEKARIEGIANEYGALGSSIGGAFVSGFSAAEEGQNKFAEGFKAMTAQMIDSALGAMQNIVTIRAAEAAAGAASSQAGIPIVGPALAAAAAATMFSLVRGFIQLGFQGMAQGGVVKGGVQGHDSVPIMAQAGEMVLSRNQVDRMRQEGGLGGGGQVTIEMNSQIPAGRAEIKRFVRQNVVPALKELRTQGMF